MTAHTPLLSPQGVARYGHLADALPLPRPRSSYAQRLPGHLLRCTVAGLVGGPLGLALTNLSDPGEPGPLMIFAGIFALIGALEGHFVTRRPLGAAAGGLVGVFAAAIFLAVAASSGWSFGPLLLTLGLLGAAAAALSSPPIPALRSLRAFCVGLSTLVGVLVAYTLFIDASAPTALTTPIVAEAGFGASLGFFFALGGVGAMAIATFDEVARRWQRVGRTLHGEPAEVARRAVRLRRDIVAQATSQRDGVASDGPWMGEILTIATRTTLHMLDVAAHLCSTTNQGCDAHRVRARLLDLEMRIDHTSDAAARAEYTAAAHSLRAQLRRHDQLDGERERLLARLHRGLSALERLHLLVLDKERSDAPTALPSERIALPMNTRRARTRVAAKALLG